MEERCKVTVICRVKWDYYMYKLYIYLKIRNECSQIGLVPSSFSSFLQACRLGHGVEKRDMWLSVVGEMAPLNGIMVMSPKTSREQTKNVNCLEVMNFIKISWRRNCSVMIWEFHFAPAMSSVGARDVWTKNMTTFRAWIRCKKRILRNDGDDENSYFLRRAVKLLHNDSK